MTSTASSKDWHILRTTGQRLTFQGLAKLQELITNDEVTVEDLLSRDGKKWKRLGDIAELGGIFAEVSRRRSMPFGAYDGPPQTMVMPTMTERQAATLTMPTALERPPATLSMPTFAVPSASPSQETLDGRDMEYTSKAGKAPPKDAPPATLVAVSRAPVVLSSHQKPTASPSAIKGVQGFQVREEPAARFAETPKLPFATTAPPEAIERRAAATPAALRTHRLPEETIEHPRDRMPAPSPSGVTETGAYTASKPVMSPSGRFPVVRPGGVSAQYGPKPAEPFPARPASPQIPRGQSGSFPVTPRAISGTYRVAESNEEPQSEEPLSTLRFHSSVEAKAESGAPSTLKMGPERAGAESPLATVRMTSGRFAATQHPADGAPVVRPYANEDSPELERSDTLKYGPGQVAADIAATVREMPRVPVSDEDDKQKTTLQGVGAVPARTRAEPEPIAPYTTNSPSSLVSVSPELFSERPRSSNSDVLARSGEFRRVEAQKSEERNLAEPVIHSLTSSPLFEKKTPRAEESAPPPSPDATLNKPRPAPQPGEDNWQMGQKSSPTDIEDTFLIPNRRKRSRAPVVIGAVLAGGLAVLLAKPSFLFGSREPAAPTTTIQPVSVPKQQQLVSDGEALLWSDDDESLKKAPTKFLQALGIEEDYAPALRGLVLSYTILAQRLKQEHQIETLRAATLPKEEAAKINAILEAAQKKGEPESLLKDAAQYAEKLAKIAPDDLDAQAALGEFQFATQDAALSETLKRVHQYPGSWQEKWLLALSASRQEPMKAVSLLRELLSQRPEMLRARYQLAVMLLQEDKIVEARQEAEAILKVNPKHDRARDLLAHWSSPTSAPTSTPAVEPTGNPPTPATKATNEPEQPAKTPKTPSEWVQEGDRKMKAGRTSDAISDYLEASSLDRRHLPAYLKAGDAYMKQKGASSAAYACSQYKSALNISPDNADAIYGLASCSLQMGNSNEALKQFQRYIDLYPQSKQSANAERRIKELTKEAPKETPKEPTTSPSN